MNKQIYRGLSGLFWFIRQFGMPNPFKCLTPGITVQWNATPVLLTPDLLNWIAGGFLPAFTFIIVGLYYFCGSFPELGSVLFMVFFVIHANILSLIASVFPNYWLIALIALAYIGLHVGIIVLQYRLDW